MAQSKFTLSRWMEGNGPELGTVISSRVRVARNIEGLPFPYLASAEQNRTVLEKVIAAAGQEAFRDFTWKTMEELQPLEKQVLVEKHLISPFLAREADHGAVLLRRDEAISVMVNEEDHLRIRQLCRACSWKKPGWRPTATTICWKPASITPLMSTVAT